MRTLPIQSGQGNYAATFHESIETVVERLLQIPKAVVAIDRKVARLYAKQLEPVTSKLPTLLLDATEEEKTFDGLIEVSNWLQEQGCNKQSVLITIGGGIIQDICALSAHLFYRGIQWIFVPTTLLSMSDSCIGAKCGINLNQYKNQIGCFHSPAEVLICTQFTKTLADADIASGYGEILKLMFTGSTEHLAKLDRAIDGKGLRNENLLQLIFESLEVKKKVIEIDEYERDLRRILNYGHTFGHALESMTDHEVPHGLAVAWGMDLVNFIAMKRGMLSKADFETTHQFIKKHLPFQLETPIEAEELINGAKKDKKVADGQINLILAERPGSLKIVKTPFNEELETQITEYIENHNVFA